MPRLIVGLLVVLAVAGFLTRPGADEVEAELREGLYQRLFTTEIDAGRDMLGNAAIIACRLDPATCFDVLRQGLEVRYEDRWLYAKVEVEGFRRRAECWGAFGQFWCPGGFSAPAGS